MSAHAKERRIAQSPAELSDFLAETICRSEFTIRPIRFSEQKHWAIREGALSHFSNGFFQIAGIRHRDTAEEHLVLYQPQNTITGLAIFKGNHEVYVLLQARVEPGLPNVAQYGPTIQSTAANYLQMHGGEQTPYAELFRGFSPIANPLGNNKQFDLGRRYFQKNKDHSYLELYEQIPTAENMIWVPLPVIAAVLAYDNFLNADLRSLLSGIDWDLFANDEYKSEEENMTAVDHLYTPNLLGNNEWRMMPLEQLSGWQVVDEGILDVSGSGIWVDMFHVSALNREVKHWSQPLMNCANRGLAVLFVRQLNGRYEFLVSLEKEFGISGQRVVLPSLVIYPGENPGHIANIGEKGALLAEILQTDEGGRFFQTESFYQVILVEDEIAITPQQQWVTAETLKSILKSSCRASIQLRCIASLVLDLLNPCSFS